MSDAPLAGRTIGITADRRWQEQANLFTARGATIVHGPTMRTMDLSADERLRAATASLIERPPDYLVATTGAGIRMWFEAAASWDRLDPLKAALGGARVVARGAKSASALRQAGLEVWWRAPRETMEDVVARLVEADVSQARVALQLFDPTGHESTAALAQAAGELVEVAVYRWLLPEDRAPAERLIRATAAGELAAVTFTSQPAVHNLFRLAEAIGLADGLRAAFEAAVLPACIGPVCAEALAEEGVGRLVFPEPSRLPAMVRQVTELLGSPQAAAS
ncbi:MAG: uroporphyrinogen-III synthase [Acidimicrobiaceae bacterium]|jgi:uroporphyrinogen-III synthase|nr:uroporphyrinogen-III synthase [Acidimicrobiaceae bacterium]